MDQLDDKLGAILGNPDLMQQIMSMAQSLSNPQEAPPSKAEPQRRESASGDLDMASVQKLMQFARQTGIDRNQQNLLKALDPFLSAERIQKLERAMRAAKLANLASSALGQLNFGR